MQSDDFYNINIERKKIVLIKPNHLHTKKRNKSRKVTQTLTSIVVDDLEKEKQIISLKEKIRIGGKRTETWEREVGT